MFVAAAGRDKELPCEIGGNLASDIGDGGKNVMGSVDGIGHPGCRMVACFQCLLRWGCVVWNQCFYVGGQGGL
jgi:hypothetical protein